MWEKTAKARVFGIDIFVEITRVILIYIYYIHDMHLGTYFTGVFSKQYNLLMLILTHT